MTREPVQSNLPQLFERNRELAEIDACIKSAAAEQGSFVVLEGRAGMGKSTLLAQARRRANRAGFAICTATASELESGFAYGVVRQLFEPAVGGVRDGDRARLFEGAAALAVLRSAMADGIELCRIVPRQVKLTSGRSVISRSTRSRRLSSCS